MNRLVPHALSMRQSFVSLLLTVAAVGLLSSCSKPTQDDVIAKDIQMKVATEPKLKNAEVDVIAKSASVTLKGKVSSNTERSVAEKIAQNEPGVLAVDDQTSIDVSAGNGLELPQTPATVPQPPPPPKPTVIPAGTVLTLRLGQDLGSRISQTGATFKGSLLSPITIDGTLAIPEGSLANGAVMEAKQAGRFRGAAVLRLTLHSLTVNGHKYNIATTQIIDESTGKGKRTAVMAAGGGGGGAAIGGLAGGGKGAAIGALVGVTAGVVGAGTTGNRDITFPSESALSFTLKKPLTLKPNVAELSESVAGNE